MIELHDERAFVAADLGAAIVPHLSADPRHAGAMVMELPVLEPA